MRAGIVESVRSGTSEKPAGGAEFSLDLAGDLCLESGKDFFSDFGTQGMFTYCVKLLVMGMMGLHSLLGCHVHHLSAACCPVPQLEWSPEKESKRQVSSGHADCRGCRLKSETAAAAVPADVLLHSDDFSSGSSEQLPIEGCCSESRCVFLSEVMKAQLVAAVSLSPESTWVDMLLKFSKMDLEAWKTRCFRQWRPPTAPALCAIQQCWLL